MLIDDAQMGDVGKRIFKLTLRKRSLAPICKARRLIDFRLYDLPNQRFVRGGLAEAADHGCDLSIE